MEFVSCLLSDRVRDWWEEVSHVVGFVFVVAITLEEFLMRFQEEFAPEIEVQ